MRRQSGERAETESCEIDGVEPPPPHDEHQLALEPEPVPGEEGKT